MNLTEAQYYKQILNSKWAENYNSQTLSFYQLNPVSTIPIKYGLYSTAIDRFFLVDGLDLSAISLAAKILSSKISSLVCVFTSEPPPFTLENCLMWSLTNKDAILPKKQTPELYFVKNSDECIFSDTALDFKHKISQLVRDQEYMLFVLKACSAITLTELFLNSHAKFNNIDQNFYMQLFSEFDKTFEITTAKDKAGFELGFHKKILQILYVSCSIEEALNHFSELIMIKNDDLIFKYRSIYMNTFNKYLNVTGSDVQQ